MPILLTLQEFVSQRVYESKGIKRWKGYIILRFWSIYGIFDLKYQDYNRKNFLGYILKKLVK